MSVICRRFFPRTWIVLELIHASTLSIWSEEIQAKSEEGTTQTAIYCDTFRLQSFVDTSNTCSSLADGKILCVIVQFFLCFILNLRAVSKYKLLGAYIWRGDLTKGFLR